MNRETLTLEKFNLIEAGDIIDIGLLPNSPNGLFMTDRDQGRLLCWVAKKGYGDDWAIYCQWTDKSIDHILNNGDKVTGEMNIKTCLPCDDEVYNKYRR